ncbi:MAG: hydroxysqualene dehydroxylase HpnE [Thiobacillus sp.]
MTTSNTPSVAVIGGGWAGCAAALTLAEAGVAVTLHEASRTLGGRARAVEVEDLTLDNGQHILLGAYTQTRALISRLSSTDALWALPLAIHQPPDFYLRCPRLPAPMHLLAGLLSARGLSWREKFSAVAWVQKTLRTTTLSGHQSVAQLTQQQPARLNRLLWHPLCISALNTPPESASAQIFCDVLRAAFGGRAEHSDLLLPRRDLTTLLPAPAAERIAALGGVVQMSSRVSQLADQPDNIALHTQNDHAHYSHVIVAVAPQHLADLLTPFPALADTLTGLAAYTYQPIATAYLQFDAAVRLEQPLYALRNGPAQFVFDRGQSHGQAGLLALVASAASDLPDDWLEQAEAQLHQVMAVSPPRWRKRIIEKQATYACVPGLLRPAVRTAHPRIFLAGDYTVGDYPATLESATVSGVQSAEAVLESL